MPRTRTCTIIVSLALAAAAGRAQDWPHWRGPSGNGSSPVKGLPATWSQTENVLWATVLPGPGEATPVIRGGKVFLSSLQDDTEELLAMALDARNGKVLWQHAVGKSRKAPQNRMVAPSPTAGETRVYFLYGTGDLAAFEHDGRRAWTRRLEEDYGPLSLKYGYSASPLLHDGRLYVAVLRRPESYPHNRPQAKGQDSFLLAIDPASGKDLWRHVRKTEAHNESHDSYASPIAFTSGGRSQIVVAGGDCLTGHDPAGGKELWRWTYNAARRDMQRLVPTPVAMGKLLFFVTPQGGAMGAIRPGPEGELKAQRVAWQVRRTGPDVCSPLYYRGALYVLEGKRKKVLYCLDPASGDVRWEGRLGRTVFRASPTGADGRIYCINRAGEVYVLSTEKFEILAHIPMGGKNCDASIAAADGTLFIRTSDKLYCIGAKAK